VRIRPSRPTALRVVAACLLVCVAGVSVRVAPASAATTGAAPLSGGTEIAGGSWAVLPMGQLSDPSNTFWQLLRAEPGSSRWSVVTPQGVADNGGLVAGASAGSTAVGTLPSGLLRFSPLSVSADAGTTWSPLFLPGALAARPDALAVAGGPGGGSLAIVGGRVVRAGPAFASWSTLVSLPRLAHASPRCDADALEAVAAAPDGAPLVATGCRRSGVVGVFTASAGGWAQIGPALPRGLAGRSASVLRLETSGTVTVALVAAGRGSRLALVVLRQNGAGPWQASAPLAVAPGDAVRATAVGLGGTVSILVGSKNSLSAAQIPPGGAWAALPAPPAGTVALAWVSPSATSFSGVALDALAVVGGTGLRVYALTPSGARWARVQSTQVPLAYGSSG
jgi:hypothetical protein